METFKWTVIAVALFVIPAILYDRWHTKDLAKIVIPGPILMTIYMSGGNVSKMADGTINNWPYNLLVSGINLNSDSQNLNSAGMREYSGDMGDAVGQAEQQVIRGLDRIGQNQSRIIMMVTLPTRSLVHILGTGHQAASDSIPPTFLLNNGMTAVQLEGDFPDYFKLYCDQDHEVELRQVLDPATMQVLVDYCQEYEWEIEGEYLYIVERDSGIDKPRKDSTNLVQDAAVFTQHLERTLRQFSLETTHSARQSTADSAE